MIQGMKIGEVARQAGVTQRTVRYYETLGLLPPGERVGGGHHYYAADTVARLQKIDKLKRIGLSLDEIGEVIDLYFTDLSGVQAKQKILPMLRRHLAETEGKLGVLQSFRDELLENIQGIQQFLEASDRS